MNLIAFSWRSGGSWLNFSTMLVLISRLLLNRVSRVLAYIRGAESQDDMLFGDTVSLQIGRDAFGIVMLNPQLSIDNINAGDTGVNPFVFLVSSDHPQVMVCLTVNDNFVFQISVSDWCFCMLTQDL